MKKITLTLKELMENPELLAQLHQPPKPPEPDVCEELSDVIEEHPPIAPGPRRG